MRTLLTFLVLLLDTFFVGGSAAVAQFFGVKYRPGGIYDAVPKWWGKLLLMAAGVEVVPHGDIAGASAVPSVYIANHVSWFDIPVSAWVLPRFGFMAKRELERYPVFGAAARAVGVIFIDRNNHKAAFGAYDDAAAKVQGGRSVLVYPEGTRGRTYALRPFKKGPFVLAIQAQAPIVPVVIHGTIAVNPRGKFKASPGVVHVHVLEPVSTVGLTYDDRDALAERIRLQMAEVLRTQHGVEPALEGKGAAAADATAVTA